MVLPLGDSHRTLTTPIVTYLIIALNVAAYALQLDRGDRFTIRYAATPFEITHNTDLVGPVPVHVDDDPQDMSDEGRDEPERLQIEQGAVPFPVWFTLFTAMFLHGSPMHLAGNMLYLWIFGDNCEEVLGRVRYLIVYLACGLLASLAQIAAAPDSHIPTLGASGAIAGVMGMYLVWFPYNRVRVLVFRFIIEVPAVIMIGLWIAFQVVQGVGSYSLIGVQGGVAYLAHIGGAVAGAMVGYLFRKDARALGVPTIFDRIRG